MGSNQNITPSPLINKHERFKVKPKVPGTYSVNSAEMSMARERE